MHAIYYSQSIKLVLQVSDFDFMNEDGHYFRNESSLLRQGWNDAVI